MDYTVHGILQARILEWVAFPFPADLPDPGIKPGSPALQVDSLPTELPGKSLVEINELILKFIWKGTGITKTTSKMNKGEGLTNWF